MNRKETKILVEDWRRLIAKKEISFKKQKPSLNEYKTWNQTIIAIFDVLGWVPVLGSVTSGINAIICLKQEKYFHSICYLISMIPVKGKIVGKTAKTIFKIISPYYKKYKAGELDLQEILDDPSDDIVNFALAILEHKTKILKILYFIIDKEDVSDRSEAEFDKFFEFLSDIKRAKEAQV